MIRVALLFTMMSSASVYAGPSFLATCSSFLASLAPRRVSLSTFKEFSDSELRYQEYDRILATDGRKAAKEYLEERRRIANEEDEARAEADFKELERLFKRRALDLKTADWFYHERAMERFRKKHKMLLETEESDEWFWE